MTITVEQKELIEACKKGDRKAQYRVYNQYSKAMYNICLRMMNDQMDAENMLQSSFLDVFTKIEQYRFEATLGAWIKRITVNKCLNTLRKRKLEWMELNDEVFNKTEEEKAEKTDVRFTIENVKDAMKELSDGYRIVFSLFCLEGYDHKEISSIAGISESTSKSQLSRAKAKIRQIIIQKEQKENEKGSIRRIH